MKKAFTLVELLIVIVVIAILMAITFQIMGMGEDQEAKITTIMRMQALENAMNGYYAAFGSYPPVPLHRSRNIYYDINSLYIQDMTQNPDKGKLKWERVEAACRAQPVAVLYPFRKRSFKRVKEIGEDIVKRAQAKGGDIYSAAGAQACSAEVRKELLVKNPKEGLWIDSQSDGEDSLPEWNYCQAFQFGLLSFLLPRYLVMMRGADPDIYDALDQWKNNNEYTGTRPAQFEDGVPYKNWRAIADQVRSKNDESESGDDSNLENRDAWKVAVLPSQSVTARWMPCLERILFPRDPILCEKEEYLVYGVNIVAKKPEKPISADSASVKGRDLKVYSHGETHTKMVGMKQMYFLDGFECWDGWKNEFYYYSPPPYQSYCLWSAGKNAKTFPPWISEGEIEKMGAKNVVREWKQDDIIHLKN